MSKMSLLMLHFTPLCLKIRGRIVGAVSRMTLTIYIAFGLLVVSSMLLFIIFFGIKNDQDARIRPEISITNQATEPLEDQSAVIAVSPQTIAEPVSVPKIIEQPAPDVVASVKPISGPIKVDFGWQLHEVYKDWRYHTGIDISGPRGSSVEAIYNGQVKDIFRDNHSGLTVVVKDNIYSVYYGSLAEVRVEKGSSIRGGQTIGTMGSFDAEPYTHLHLAIKKEDQYIDPKLVIHQE